MQLYRVNSPLWPFIELRSVYFPPIILVRPETSDILVQKTNTVLFVIHFDTISNLIKFRFTNNSSFSCVSSSCCSAHFSLRWRRTLLLLRMLYSFFSFFFFLLLHFPTKICAHFSVKTNAIEVKLKLNVQNAHNLWSITFFDNLYFR